MAEILNFCTLKFISNEAKSSFYPANRRFLLGL